MCERNSFVFYGSWWVAIKNLPRDVQGDVLTAIIEYGLTGETTEQLKPITKAMLAMIKPQIDSNNQRFENGKKGGRPNKSETEQKPNENQTETEQKPNENQTETEQKPNENQTETKGKPNVICICNINNKETTTNVVAKKGEKNIAALAATNERKQEFYKSLIPFVDRYGKETIRDFFDYWSEMNKSKTKMRFENEKTWETNLRLSTWERRSKKHATNKRETKPVKPVEETDYGEY